jgi:M6 family metalloprotease-like protein
MRYLIVLFFVVSCAYLNCAYLTNQPVILTQPDGSVLKCFASGHEFSNRYHDKNDYTIYQDKKTGWYVYADEKDGWIVPTGNIPDRNDPSAVGLRPGIIGKTENSAANHEMYLRRQSDVLTQRTATTGTLNNLVVMIRFSDQDEYTSSATHWTDMFNNSTVSLKSYYREVSTNQLTINSSIYPPANGSTVVSYQSIHPRNYYVAYQDITNEDGYINEEQGMTRLHELFYAAISAISAQVPITLDIDNNNDNIADNVCFIIQGNTEGWSDVLWPHWWVMAYCDPIAINGARIYSYNLQMSSSTGTPVLCHEMGHSLGIPDYYHYEEAYNYLHPVGSWDLMGNESNPPQHMSPFLKYKYLHWVSSLPVITGPGTYTLLPVATSPYACYKTASPNNPNEYFILEYRRKTGTFEVGLPGEGLIIKRIINGIEGNAGGPPDEMYVYRPGGTTTADGNLSNASFSSNVGRTFFNDATNPSAFLSSGLPSGLSISNIGSAGNTITFTILNELPPIWTGNVSNNWHEPGNWQISRVPNTDDDVIIPSDCTTFPVISHSNAYCRNLLVQNGSTLFIQGFGLRISQDANIAGSLNISYSGSVVEVNDDITFTETSALLIGSGATLIVKSDLTTTAGMFMSNYSGTVTFSGTGNSLFTLAATNYMVNNLVVSKTNAYLMLTASSNKDFTINGNLTVNSTSTFRVNSYINQISLKGNLSGSGTTSLSDGTLKLTGTAPNINVGAAGYVNNLTINTTGNVYLANNIEIRGNFTITTGALACMNYAIHIKGNWVNSKGPAAFYEGTGIVYFEGTGDQTCTTEEFYRIIMNKSSGNLKINTGATVTCQLYDWSAGTIQIAGGSFDIAEVQDTSILGNYIVSSGYLTFNQDAAASVDLNANLTISGGFVTIKGGDGHSDWAVTNNINITMSNGTLKFDGISVHISNTGYNYANTITGGTIEVSGDFLVDGAGFIPSGGTILLNNWGSNTLHCVANSHLYNVEIDKHAILRNGEPIRLNQIIINSDTQINGKLTVTDGLLNISSCTVDINGDLEITGSLQMDAANEILYVDGSVKWFNNSTANVTDGEIHVKGNWNFNSGTEAALGTSNLVYFESSGTDYLTSTESNAAFGSVIVNKSGGSLLTSFNGGTYNITGTLTIQSGSFESVSGTLNFDDVTTVNSSSTLKIGTGSSSTVEARFYNLTVSGSFNQSGGTTVVENNFILNSTGTLTINNGIFLLIKAYASTYVSLGGVTTINNGVFEITNNGMQFGAASDFIINGGTVRIGWGIRANTVGGFQQAHGAIELIGTQGAPIEIASGNYFYDLTINKSSTSAVCYLSGDTKVNHNLTVNGGQLDVLHRTLDVANDVTISGTGKLLCSNSDDLIKVGKSWNNQRGTAYFAEGAGSVQFYSDNEAYLNSDESFNNLTVNKTDYSLWISEGKTITATGNVLVSAGLFILKSQSTLNVTGNLTVNASSKLLCSESANARTVSVIGDVTINTGGEIELNSNSSFTNSGSLTLDGTLKAEGSSYLLHGILTTFRTSSLYISGGSFICDAPATQTYLDFLGSLTLSSGLLESTNIGIQFLSTATNSVSGGIIRTKGYFTVIATNTFQPTGGTFEFTGTDVQGINMSNSNWLYNLRINAPGGTFSIGSDLIVKHDVIIDNGTLNLSSHAIDIAGSWTNNVGDAGFIETGSTVTFSGNASASILTDEKFASVFINKGTTYPNALSIAENNTVRCTGNLTIQQGVLKLGNGAVLDADTNISISLGAGLHASGESAQTQVKLGSHLLDSNTSITTSTGFYAGNLCLVTFDGTLEQTISTGVTSLSLYKLSVDKASGNFKPYCNLYVANDFILNGGTWVYSGSELTHHFSGNFYIQNTGLWSDAQDNIILEGNINSNLFASSLLTCKSLTINKTAVEPNSALPYVILTNQLELDVQAFNIDNGHLDTAGYILKCDGNLTINDNADMLASGNTDLMFYPGSIINVNSGGLLSVSGVTGNEVSVTKYAGSTGTYTLNINSGGKIAAKYAIFEYISSTGLNVKSGALVDAANSFNNCTFRNGASAGTLLTVNNNQNIRIDAANFPTNTWGGLKNVAKTQNSGSIAFTNETGAFAGTPFENDDYTRINWSGNVPQIYVTADSLIYNDVTMGTYSSQYFIIMNAGTATLTGDITAPEGFYVLPFGRNNIDYSVNAGSSKTFEVRFQPTSPISYRGSMVITHNATGAAETILLKGQGIGAQITCTPEMYRWDLISGNNASATMTIGNTGNRELYYYATVSDSTWLRIDNKAALSDTIQTSQPNQECTISVNTSGLSSGWHMGNITIYSNDQMNSMKYISVTVVIGIPAMTMYDSLLAFGQLFLGTNYTRSFIIQNMGTIRLTGTITAPPGFSVAQDSLPPMPAPGGRNSLSFMIETMTSATFDVTFAPTETGYYNENLIINSNTGVPDTLVLTGYGIYSPVVTTSAVTNIRPQSATCGGNVTSDGGMTITYRGLCWGDSPAPDIDNDNFVYVAGTTGVFSDEISLQPGTHYHLRAFAQNTVGRTYGNEIEFTTLTPQLVVSTDTIPSFGGIALGSHSAPQSFTISGTNLVDFVMISSGTDFFEISQTPSGGEETWLPTMTLYPEDGTLPETTLYVRFSPSAAGSFWELIIPLSVAANSSDIYVSGNGVMLPSIMTGSIIDTTKISATGSGMFTSDGYDPNAICGLCWSTSPDPTLANPHTDEGYQTGYFSSPITGLETNTTYYVRAYAQNAAGTSYGDNVYFKTLGNPQIIVSALAIPLFDNVMIGTISAPDSLTISASQLYSQLYISSDSGFEIELSFQGRESRAFSNFIYIEPSDGEIAESQLLIRFNAVAGGTSSGYITFSSAGADTVRVAVSGKGIDFPSITTAAITDTTINSANGGGSITSAGFDLISACGICWSTVSEPTIFDQHTDATPLSTEFSLPISQLASNSTYFVRAFAQNDAGVAYGNEISFTTLASPAIEVSQSALAYFGSIVAGSYSEIDTFAVSAIELSDSLVISAPAGYQISLTGEGRAFYNRITLAPVFGYVMSVPVYVRFAPVSGGVIEANILLSSPGAENCYVSVTGNGIVLPVVTTREVTGIETSAALSGGNITSVGYDDIISCGVCWNTTGSPVLADSLTNEGSQFGQYLSDLNNLIPGTHYYLRAYAGNQAGIAYGNQLEFETLPLSIDIPQNVRISVINGEIVLEWNEVLGALHYKIYKSEDPHPIDWGIPFATVTEPTWTETQSPLGEKYFYRIKASSD